MAFTVDAENVYVKPEPKGSQKEQKPVFPEAVQNAIEYLEESIEQAEAYFVRGERCSPDNPLMVTVNKGLKNEKIIKRTKFFSAPNWTIVNKKAYLESGKPAQIKIYAKTTGGGKCDGFFKDSPPIDYNLWQNEYRVSEAGLIPTLKGMKDAIANCTKEDEIGKCLIKEAVASKNKSLGDEATEEQKGKYNPVTDMVEFPS